MKFIDDPPSISADEYRRREQEFRERKEPELSQLRYVGKVCRRARPQRRHPDSIPIICVETSQEFPSMAQARRWLFEQNGKHVGRSSFRAAMHRKHAPGQIGGYAFRWGDGNQMTMEDAPHAGNDTRKRPVRCLTTGQVYPSIQEGARAVGGKGKHLWGALNRIFKGMRWEYAD